MFISRKKFNAELSKSFLDGHELGRKSNQLAYYTPNEIRELLELNPIYKIDTQKNVEPIAKVIGKERTEDGLFLKFKLTEYGKTPEVQDFLRKIGIEVDS